MKSFKQYIMESNEASTAFKSARQLSSYIKSPKYRELYLESLDELESAAQNKEIYNARFNEYKIRLTRGIEYAYTTLFEKIKDDLIAKNIETIDLWSITTTAEINKVVKIYDKMNYNNREVADFMNAIKDIPAALKTMKSYVKAGKPPKEPKPGQFIKPVAAHEASKIAVKYMTDAADSFIKDLSVSINNDVRGTFEKIKNARTPADIPTNDENAKNIATTIFIIRQDKDRKKYFELKPNATALLDKMIQNTVESIVDGFIGKNSAKLALIFQKKNQPKAHSLIRTNIRNGMVENTMKFSFEDGSEFVLESSVVYKYSKTGKLFFQYPTRFKNVRFADGSMMKGPSEEKMIKEF